LPGVIQRCTDSTKQHQTANALEAQTPVTISVHINMGIHIPLGCLSIKETPQFGNLRQNLKVNLAQNQQNIANI
jgi:hypothetical protein